MFHRVTSVLLLATAVLVFFHPRATQAATSDATTPFIPVFEVTVNTSTQSNGSSPMFYKTFTIVSTSIIREVSVDLPGRVFVAPSDYASPAPVLPVVTPKPKPTAAATNATGATNGTNAVNGTDATNETHDSTSSASSSFSSSSSPSSSPSSSSSLSSLSSSSADANGIITLASVNVTSNSTKESQNGSDDSADRDERMQEEQDHHEKELLEQSYPSRRIVATIVVSSNDSKLLDLVQVVGIPTTPLPQRSAASRKSASKKDLLQDAERARAAEQKGFVVHLKPNAYLHTHALLLTEISLHQLGRLSVVTANSANDFIVDDQSGLLVHNGRQTDLVFSANSVQRFFVTSSAVMAIRSVRMEFTDLALVQMQLPTLKLTERLAMSATDVEVSTLYAERVDAVIVYTAMTGIGDSNWHVKYLNTSELETQVLGDAYFAYQGNGSCEHQRLFMQGDGAYQAGDIWSNFSYISIAGFGNATVHAHSTLDCSILPNGKVFYVDETPLKVNAMANQLVGDQLGVVKSLSSKPVLKQYTPKPLPPREPLPVTLKLAGVVQQAPRPLPVKIETSSNSGDEDDDEKAAFRGQVLTIVFAALGFVVVVVAFGSVRDFVRQRTLRRSYQQLP